MGVAGGAGDEEVGAFLFLWCDGAVWDLVGVAHAPDAAFVEEFGFGNGEPLDVVAIDEMAADADGVVLVPVFLDVFLGDDVRADHAARLADVELVG